MEKPATSDVIVNGCLLVKGVVLIGLPYQWAIRVVRSLGLSGIRVPGSPNASALDRKGAHDLVDAWARYKSLPEKESAAIHAKVDALDLASDPRNGQPQEAASKPGGRAGARKMRVTGSRARSTP
jgi:hypothetical protein